MFGINRVPPPTSLLISLMVESHDFLRASPVGPRFQRFRYVNTYYLPSVFTADGK